METSPELIAVMVSVFAVLKLAMMAINKLVNHVTTKDKQTKIDKREERLALMEEKVEKIEDTLTERKVRFENLEKVVQDLHDCIDRIEEKTDRASEQTNTRLNAIQEVLFRLDGKFDAWENMFKNGKK